MKVEFRSENTKKSMQILQERQLAKGVIVFIVIGALCVLGGVLMLIFHPNKFSGIVLILVGVGLSVVFLAVGKSAQNKQNLEIGAFAPGRAYYRFEEDALFVQLENWCCKSDFRLSYDAICKVAEDRDLLLFYYSNTTFYAVEKASLIAGSCEELTAFLKERFQKQYQKKGK